MASKSVESFFSRWRIVFAVGIIVLAALGAYHNSFSGPFIFDDINSLPENSHIRQLWPIWETVRAGPGTTVAGRPVLSLSFALNYQISGLEVWSYHAVNLAVHILAALTLFGIVRRTLLCEKPRVRFGKASFSLALICALSWMLHPLQTSSVTYIVQRAESLMGLLYLLSLYCAMRGFSSTNRLRWYTLAILACALGMGVKEVMVTAPLMVLLYDRIFVSRSFKEIFNRRWGLYVGLATTWLIFGGLAFSAPRGNSVGFGVPGLTCIEYAMTQCKIIVSSYLKLSFWPWPLVFDYGWPMVRSFAHVVPHALVLIAMLIATLVALRYWPSWGFLGVWFFVILAPSSSFLPILTEVAAEHRMYLPLAAIVVAVVVGGYLVLTRCAKLGHVLGYVLAAVVIMFLGPLSFERNYDYASAVSIWQATVSDCPSNFRAWNNLGIEYKAKGAFEQAIGSYNQAIALYSAYTKPYHNKGNVYAARGEHDRAILDYNKAIKLDQNYVNAYNSRGSSYLAKGEINLAIRDFDKVVALSPKDAKGYNNRGLAYDSKGELDRALRDFGRAIELSPKSYRGYYNRGLTYKRKGEIDLAILDFDQAIKLNPDDAAAYNYRGIAYSRKGDLVRAIRDFGKVIELRPGDAEAYNNRGLANSRKGEYERAIGDLDKAIELNPKYTKAYNNRGLAYMSNGKLERAIHDFNNTIELNPKYSKAYNNRGLAYKSKGEHGKAIRDFEKVVQLALASGDQKLAKDLQSNLELYKAKHPYRKASSPK